MFSLTQLSDVLSVLDLEPAYDWVRTCNQSNDLPYHNLRHLESVAVNAAILGQAAGLPYGSLRLLVLAALLHDVNHSGGQCADSENILRALMGAAACAASIPGVSEQDWDTVARLIRATEFPLVAPAADDLECILRDADMMQISYDGWYSHVFDGLRQEMGVRAPIPMDMQAFCHLSRGFYTTLAFHSDWGKRYGHELKALALARIQTVERLLDWAAALKLPAAELAPLVLQPSAFL